MEKPHVIILGAGPAGLGAAYRLGKRGIRVTVLEANAFVGGNASSFQITGLDVDFGSHRLHPSCDPKVMSDIRTFLGDDLLDRPRHGRIRLRGRWIHFPLKPLDLALRLPPSFVFGVTCDLAAKIFRRRRASSDQETFATVLEGGLGATICRDFYFPYARKVWGLEPEALSVTQARRRVGANSLGKMIRKVLNAIPGFKPKGSGRFFYPRHGYGQICAAYARAAEACGAQIQFNARVQSVEIGKIKCVRYEHNGQIESLAGDQIWSTIPITLLTKMIQPRAPHSLLNAADQIQYRAMILIYLVLEQDRFSEFDAHYFPETHIRISRMSEPKNYSHAQTKDNVTVLCAELPCMTTDPEWQMSDDELAELMCDSLVAVGIPIRAPIRQVVTRRLRQAYPIYQQGYEAYFDQLDDWLSRIDGLLTFGRQGLFAHDNTHHALFMAYSAAECLNNDGIFDRARWQSFRRVFETHVVED